MTAPKPHQVSMESLLSPLRVHLTVKSVWFFHFLHYTEWFSSSVPFNLALLAGTFVASRTMNMSALCASVWLGKEYNCDRHGIPSMVFGLMKEATPKWIQEKADGWNHGVKWISTKNNPQSFCSCASVSMFQETATTKWRTSNEAERNINYAPFHCPPFAFACGFLHGQMIYEKTECRIKCQSSTRISCVRGCV